MATVRSVWERVKEAMADAGWHPTQAVLSEKVKIAQSGISDWNKEGQGPTVSNAVAMAEALGVCVEWIYTERGPKRPEDSFNTADPDLRKLLQVYTRLNTANRDAVIAHAEFTLERQRQQSRASIKPVT